MERRDVCSLCASSAVCWRVGAVGSSCCRSVSQRVTVSHHAWRCVPCRTGSQRVFNFDRDAPLRRQRLAAIAERISAESLLDVEPRLDADTVMVPVSVDYDAFGMDEELTPEVMGRLEAAQRTKLRLRMHERLMRETHPHQDGHPVDYLVYFCCFPVWTIVLLVVISSTDSASCDTPLHTYLFLRFMAYLSILVMMLTGTPPLRARACGLGCTCLLTLSPNASCWRLHTLHSRHPRRHVAERLYDQVCRCGGWLPPAM